MKKILMLLAFAGVASVASAQQTMTVTEYEVIQVQDKYQVITNPFWSNWFFSVGGGAQVLYGNNDHIGKFRDRVAPSFWTSPCPIWMWRSGQRCGRKSAPFSERPGLPRCSLPMTSRKRCLSLTGLP